MNARWRKLLVMAGLVTALSGGALVATEGMAFAHHAILSGTTSCPGADHVIDWSIGNSQPKQTMTIDTAVATLSGTSYSVDGYVNPIPDSGSTSATTVIPGALTGTVTLSIHSTWSDGHKRPASTTVDLDDPCPSTPTTTSTPPTTQPPTTTAPCGGDDVVCLPPPSGGTTVTTYVGTTSPCVSTATTPCTLAFTDGNTVPPGPAAGVGFALLGLGAVGIAAGGIGETRRRRRKH